MGWASGAILAESLWSQIKPLIPARNREDAARIIIEEFEQSDCDTICECVDLVTDAGLYDEYYARDYD